MTDREDAWYAVHEALPAGWTVGPPTFDPGVAGWSVTARTVAASRLKRPETVTGTGVDETAALRNLDDRLRGVPQPNGSRMAERERRIRLAHIEGAESWSRETGRLAPEPPVEPKGTPRSARTSWPHDAGVKGLGVENGSSRTRLSSPPTTL